MFSIHFAIDAASFVQQQEHHRVKGGACSAAHLSFTNLQRFRLLIIAAVAGEWRMAKSILEDNLYF
jgi:hypothetical protein